jgi:hypothetical protein
MRLDRELENLQTGMRAQITSLLGGIAINRAYMIKAIEFSGANHSEFVTVMCEDVR